MKFVTCGISSLSYHHNYLLMQYGVRIFVITSFKDTCCIEILPNSQKTKGGKQYIFVDDW